MCKNAIANGGIFKEEELNENSNLQLWKIANSD